MEDEEVIHRDGKMSDGKADDGPTFCGASMSALHGRVAGMAMGRQQSSLDDGKGHDGDGVAGGVHDDGKAADGAAPGDGKRGEAGEAGENGENGENGDAEDGRQRRGGPGEPGGAEGAEGSGGSGRPQERKENADAEGAGARVGGVGAAVEASGAAASQDTPMARLVRQPCSRFRGILAGEHTDTQMIRVMEGGTNGVDGVAGMDGVDAVGGASGAGGGAIATMPVGKCFAKVRKLKDALMGNVYHYQGVERSAEGGSHYERTGEDVAIKMFGKELVLQGVDVRGKRCGEKPLAENRFLQHLSADGGHANIVKLLGFLEDDEYYYSVQEFLLDDLFDVVDQAAGAFSENTARRMFGEIAAGLRFMHRRGICNMDVSLENMMVGHDGKCRIIDLGLSRLSDSPSRKCGKNFYISPEMYRSNHLADSAGWSGRVDPMPADVVRRRIMG